MVISLSVGLLKKLWMNFREIFESGRAWGKEQWNSLGVIWISEFAFTLLNMLILVSNHEMAPLTNMMPGNQYVHRMNSAFYNIIKEYGTGSVTRFDNDGLDWSHD